MKLPIGLSDHQLFYCTRKTMKNSFRSHNTVTLRSMKHYTEDIFNTLLATVDWSPVLNSTCPNAAWLSFKDTFISVIDQVAPQKTVRIKQRSEPWMTSSILDKISIREGLLYLYKETKDEFIKTQYCIFRNEIQREIKNAKANYLESRLNENLGQPKKLWQHLKSLGYNNKSKSKSNIVLKINGALCYETKEICSYINIFFHNYNI